MFAGKERDTATGLDYFGARYYSSQTGRFPIVDPLLEIDRNLVDPQRWNRYAYALNNPLKFTDPDGRSATLIGGIVGGSVGGGVALLQGASWREIGAAAAGGAVAGAMLGSVVDTGGASLPVLLGAGALAGIEGRLVENAINGHGTTAQEVALSGLAGTAGVAAGEVMLAGAQAMARAGVRAGLTSAGELQATHGMTMSGREFARLKADIAKNGIQDPIKYVELNGQKMVVDGHHRLRAAQALGMRNVPTQRVTLPYAGYRTPEDLVNWDR